MIKFSKKMLIFIMIMVLSMTSVKAYEVSYGLYFADKYGYWDAEKQQLSSYPNDFAWFENEEEFEIDDNGKISHLSYISSPDGSGRGQTSKSNLVYYTPEQAFYSVDVPWHLRNEKEDYSGWNSFWADYNNSGFDKIEVKYDLSNIQYYYNNYGKMPEIIVGCIENDDRWFEALTLFNSYIRYTFSTYLNENFLTFKNYIIKFYASDLEPQASDSKRTCHILATSPNVNLNTCESYDLLLTQLQRYAETKEGCNGQGFRENYNKLKDLCNNYFENKGAAFKGADGKTIAFSCSSRCENLQSDRDKICNISPEGTTCGSLGAGTVGWLMKILKIIRYIIPVLVIALSILDFITAIASSNDDDVKKAGGKFVKRIIAAAIIFILPAILQFLFDVFKIKGLESSNPFCMK